MSKIPYHDLQVQVRVRDYFRYVSISSSLEKDLSVLATVIGRVRHSLIAVATSGTLAKYGVVLYE